jgi:hypothetical protein
MCATARFEEIRLRFAQAAKSKARECTACTFLARPLEDRRREVAALELGRANSGVTTELARP